MDVPGLLCEHFVRLPNAQIEAPALRRGLPLNWKTRRSKAVVQSTATEDLRKKVL